MIGYLRVSNEQLGDQEHGLAAQRDAIEPAGWTDVQWVEDVASGKTMSRLGLGYAQHLLDESAAEGSLLSTWTGSADRCWTSPR